MAKYAIHMQWGAETADVLIGWWMVAFANHLTFKAFTEPIRLTALRDIDRTMSSMSLEFLFKKI